MEASELYEIASRGEDHSVQFKGTVTRADSLAAELVAFSNSGGGRIFVGISDQGDVVGLTPDEVGRLNQIISSAASQHVNPPVSPATENVTTHEGTVVVITVPDGLSKPYADNDGRVWLKVGADKRKAISREEVLRMYQSSGQIHGDEVPAKGLQVSEVDLKYFRDFYEAQYGSWDENPLPLSRLMENMNLAKHGVLNVAGALLFVSEPQFRLPAFVVKAVAFLENDIASTDYLDSQDLTGKLSVVFQASLGFVLRNLSHLQKDKGFNTQGDPEIPRIVLEELLANALIHRDYFTSAPVRLLVFPDRIEIVSPGCLPNNLTVENIKLGNSNMRNPILASFATKLLPYRGLGSGIVRALKAYPDIDFENDREGNLFRVTIRRPLPE